MEQDDIHIKIEEILRKTRFQFAIDSLKIVAQMTFGQNFIFSPDSIYELLCMVYFGSTGSIENSLKRVLHLSDLSLHISKDNLAQHYSHTKYSQSMTHNENIYQYFSESTCWMTNTKFIKNATQHIFKSKLELINFRTFPSDLLLRINRMWRKLLEDYMFVPAKLITIHENMDLIMSTVLCIKEKFKTIYAPSSVGTGIPRSPRIVVSSELCMIMNEIPFQNKSESLFILFPATLKIRMSEKFTEKHFTICRDISALIEKLTTREGIDELRRVLDNDEVSLSSMEYIMKPSIRFGNDLPINKLLRALGLGELLRSNEPHLQNFVSEGEYLRLGDTFHRAYLNVSPTEGTTASAISILFTKNEGSILPVTRLNWTKCEHTCLLLVYDRSRHAILFLGIMYKNLISIQEQPKTITVLTQTEPHKSKSKNYFLCNT